jgi:hypothetical protein
MARHSCVFFWNGIDVLFLSRPNVTVANSDPEARSSGTLLPLDLASGSGIVNEHKGESVENIKCGNVYCVC